MAVINLVEYDLQFALCALGDLPSEDVGYAPRCTPGQAQITGTFESFINNVYNEPNFKYVWLVFNS